MKFLLFSPRLFVGAWYRSDITHRHMEGLVRRGLLPMRTEALEWLIPGDEEAPASPDGYVVSFTHFLERRPASPPSKFLRGLLHYYTIELQHLNPNGI